jgi:hypothetical protein
VRGLNIGGWLVLEPWITPSIFQNVDQSLGIVDEFTLTQKLGSQAAYNILKPHVSTTCKPLNPDSPNNRNSGIHGALSPTSKRSQTPVSTPSESPSATGPTPSNPANPTHKVQRPTSTLQLIGLVELD